MGQKNENGGPLSKNSNLIKYLICSGFKLDPIMKTAAAINRAEKSSLVFSIFGGFMSGYFEERPYRKTGHSH